MQLIAKKFGMLFMKNSFFKVLKPLDFAVFIFALALVIYSVVFVKKSGDSRKYVVINSYDKEFIYDLSKDGVYEIEGIIGDSIIEIKDGEAFFVDSPCPNKTCVQSHAVKNGGDWIACLPNQVFLHIEAKDEEKADAVAF